MIHQILCQYVGRTIYRGSICSTTNQIIWSLLVTHSTNSSHTVSPFQAVKPSDPVAIYQSLDVCVGRNKAYKCHLKDKAKYRSVAGNPNNMLAASWPLHQTLDGLNHHENMSVIKLSISSMSDTTIATQDNRYSVTLQM